MPSFFEALQGKTTPAPTWQIGQKCLYLKIYYQERGEHDVVRKSWHWFRLQTSLYHETLCGAFSESWSINGEAEADIGCLWFLYPFNGSTIKDWLFRPQTMFCLWPFVMPILGQLCRGRTVLCVLFFERGIDMTEEQNLLSGSVPKKLAAFAFPLLLANILQSFYNVVDMLVVGQIVGDTGLAAINNASKLCYIINSILRNNL